MADIVLEYNNAIKEYDLNLENGDLKTGSDLKTAVILSLFTWGRATADEVENEAERYGFFGDKIEEENTHNIGSKLYLLKREKITAESLLKATEYIEQALNWLITDNIVSSISVTVKRDEANPNRVNAEVKLNRGSTEETLQFNNLWEFL